MEGAAFDIAMTNHDPAAFEAAVSGPQPAVRQTRTGPCFCVPWRDPEEPCVVRKDVRSIGEGNSEIRRSA